MREIKFRAWHKPASKMYTQSLESINLETKTLGIYTVNDGYQHLRLSDFELMQYTGVRDKNGDEIYEGDVVDYTVFDYLGRDTQHRGIVKWDKQEAAYYLANVDGSDFHGSDMHYLGWVSCQDPELEVIGNIYGDQNLLEVK